MIPKIIHYCWFGRKPKPELAEKCIASWKKFLPEYKYIEWNENNFPLDDFPYAKQALEAKKICLYNRYCSSICLERIWRNLYGHRCRSFKVIGYFS